MSDATAVPRKAFAVVCSGIITKDSCIVQFTDRIEAVFPVPLFIHEDKAKCESRKQSLERRIRSIKFYDGPKMLTSQPILGVVQISLPPKKEGKPMTAEHKAAMKKARDASKPKAPIQGGVHTTVLAKK